MLTTINLGSFGFLLLTARLAAARSLANHHCSSAGSRFLSLCRLKWYSERNLYRFVLRKRRFRIEKVRWYATLYSTTFQSVRIVFGRVRCAHRWRTAFAFAVFTGKRQPVRAAESPILKQLHRNCMCVEK